MMSGLPIPNALSAPDNFPFAELDVLLWNIQTHKIDREKVIVWHSLKSLVVAIVY